MKKFDFGGYVTKNNLKCTDGRTILADAFKDNDKTTVPLVWQHDHGSPSNVLGHMMLENRSDGVYGYGYFNDSPEGKNAKILVEHGDINALSIWANRLVEKSKAVVHGWIREVSLVLSGANPGALIDNVAIQHSDGSIVESDDEAIIHTGLNIELPEEEKEEEKPASKKVKTLVHAEDDEPTVAEVFETLSEEQKDAVYAIIGSITEDDGEDDMEQSDIKGDARTMKKNVFDNTLTEEDDRPVLTHAQFSEILLAAKNTGSLRKAVLEHAGTYGIDNIDYLFPDAKTVSGDPTFISRAQEWVKVVMAGTRHSPFSRIKSLHADITADEARAKGYVTGALKLEEVFGMLRRITTPTTIYKKQKLDRDDIIDITDFSVVAWLKGEMRMMLDEEIARAILMGDGRAVIAEDHIDATKLRPIWGDDPIYVTHRQVATAVVGDGLIDEVITSRTDYRGSGSPTAFVAPSLLTEWLLLKDGFDRRLYRTPAEVASELRVKEIVEVGLMEGLTRTVVADEYELLAIIVNLDDYTVGADKGGEVNMFDDFDIDYNQFKYLIETRISGALTVPKSAIVLERLVAP